MICDLKQQVNMRCKSVPRHLPRKYCTLQKLLKTKNVTESMEFLSKMKSEGGTVNIKTVNFNNYYDIVKEVDDSSANEEVSYFIVEIFYIK